MAVDSYDPVDGHPIFLDLGAPDIAVDPTEVAKYAGEVGNHPKGTTAQRLAYPYAREGIFFSDTDLDTVFYHNGSGWLPAYTVPKPATITLGSGWALSFGGAYLNGAFIVIQATFTKTSAIVSGDLVGTLPVGYRPSADLVSAGRLHGVASYNAAEARVYTNGEIRTWFTGANNETKLSVNCIFLRP